MYFHIAYLGLPLNSFTFLEGKEEEDPQDDLFFFTYTCRVFVYLVKEVIWLPAHAVNPGNSQHPVETTPLNTSYPSHKV